MSHLFSRTNLILATIVALAAFFRFYRLEQIPPGFHFDQAFYTLDVLHLLQDGFAIFFTAPGGSEPLFVYLSIVGVALFGADTPLGVKLTSAIIGLATIPIIYGFARTLFRSPSPSKGEGWGEGQSARLGLLAALFGAISSWHIFYSRDGERIGLTVLMVLLTFWFFWRALTLTLSLPRKTGEGIGVGAWVLTGICTGLALYTYPAARALPIALLVVIAFAVWDDRSRAREYLKGIMLAFAVAALVFAPLGIYYFFHPDAFISHTAQVSIFATHATPGEIAAAFFDNARKIALAFLFIGDPGSIRNVPWRPIFGPLVGVLFVVGVVVMLAAIFSRERLQRRRAVLLLTWLLTWLALSLFSDDAPNYGRMLAAMPAVMILPAWGASEIWERIRAPMARRIAAATFGVVVLTSASLVYRDYFVTFANLPELYYTFDTDKLEVFDWVKRNDKSAHIFLAPLWYQQGTLSLLTRNLPLKSFESRDTIVLPSNAMGRDALFGFPPEQEKKIQMIASRLGALGAREDLVGSNGAKILLVYCVPTQNLPDARDPLPALAKGSTFLQPQKTVRANWADQIGLLGYSIDATDSAKRNLEVTLFLHALAPMSEDYTFSIKVRDAKDRVWGQEDKWAGSNSYETTRWRAGDVVIERFYPGLTACAPAGEYRVTVEAYNPKTMQVLGDAIALGTTRAGTSSGNLPEHLEPERALDIRVAPQMHLMGLTLTPNELRAGDTFSLALFWRGQGGGAPAQRATIRLRDATNRDFVLAESEVILPGEGRGLCAFLDLSAPRDLSAGMGALFVNDVRIVNVSIIR